MNDETVDIVIPSYNLPEMTDVVIKCIKKYTEEPYRIILVDDESNKETIEYLKTLKDVNIIFNKRKWYRPKFLMKHRISAANALMLNIGAKEVTGKYMFVMHNDALPLHKGWLDFLKSKLNDKVKIAGVSKDHGRIHAVHVSGFLFEFGLYKELNMSFDHNLPEYDVGDMITKRILESGYKTYVCRNTSNNPETMEYIMKGDYPEFLKTPNMDRVFDDNNSLIYMHLGRGTIARGSSGEYKPGYLSRGDWIANIKRYYL